jgi:hypothetical protein
MLPKLSKKIFNKSFKIKTFEAYNKLSLSFLNDLAKEIKNDKNAKKFPDLIYLMFWCNSQIKLINSKKKNFLVMGRGLAYHICPSNVPTNFVYSFIFGLLSGNSNIIKIPSKNFKEKKIVLSIIRRILNKKIYKIFKDTNQFIEHSSDDEITKDLSSICDVRIIWGGDKAINQIRKNWIPEKTIDITFTDRYSFSVININKLKKESDKNLNLLAKNFFYDGYIMNQQACNSPHFVFWLGKKDLKFQNKFWTKLDNFVQKKFKFDEVQAVEKYTNLLSNIIKHNNFSKVRSFTNNNLFIVSTKKKIEEVENIRGVSGTFFEKNINKLSELKNYVSKKCQTVTYYGIEANEFKNFILNYNLFGIDRVVPIGNSLEIDLIWDGYDVIKTLSREVNFK